ncbi:hypothetical protein [Pelagovum pacificum]|uniref:Dihydroxy-acid dehydratase n=1 Tax=Pelagovum pacificum TaxID=2588711 RepID=A0A5C5GHP6_9RHOB|nr:hypothetical protein [Pelagovum pacificum]QQA42626.1 hypothetical protein I8N54_17900 [Pelagovum pacificum]TNY34223.1 hypothetical protein FHY64_13490 [Pelagovum pacificum]
MLTAGRAALLAVAAALSGCGTDLGAPLARLQPGGNAPSTSLALRDGAVTVRGPDSYCVDRTASRPADGFAIIASCARISGEGSPPALDALVTVQVGTLGSAMVDGSEAAVAAYVRTPEGQALLADGQAVSVSDVMQQPGLVLVAFRGTTGTTDPLSPPAWRAFFDIGGRLVTLGVRPYPDVPLTGDAERRLAEQAVSAIRASNRGQRS